MKNWLFNVVRRVSKFFTTRNSARAIALSALAGLLVAPSLAVNAGGSVLSGSNLVSMQVAAALGKRKSCRNCSRSRSRPLSQNFNSRGFQSHRFSHNSRNRHNDFSATRNSNTTITRTSGVNRRGGKQGSSGQSAAKKKDKRWTINENPLVGWTVTDGEQTVPMPTKRAAKRAARVLNRSTKNTVMDNGDSGCNPLNGVLC